MNVLFRGRRHAAVGIAADLTLGVAVGAGLDTLVSIENKLGSVYADNFTGGADRNTLTGANSLGAQHFLIIQGPRGLTRWQHSERYRPVRGCWGRCIFLS